MVPPDRRRQGARFGQEGAEVLIVADDQLLDGAFLVLGDEQHVE
jgi:hypothetical protein